MEIVQKISVWPYEQMVYTQPDISSGEWHTQTPLRFWRINGSLNLGQTTRPHNNQQQKRKKKKEKKKRTCKIADFAVLADHRVKSKESEKKNK